MKKRLTLCLAGGLLATASAAELGFRFETDRADALYRCGEQAVFTVTATNGAGEKVTSGRVNVALDNYGRTRVGASRSVDLSAENPFVVKGTLDKPGFLRLCASGHDVSNKWFGACWGVGFEPEKIRPGSARPADFDAFWDKAVETFAREVPIDAKMERNAKESSATHDCYDLSFATLPAGRRIYGQISVPKGKGPWPVSMRVPGAGSGSWGNIRLTGRCYLSLNVLDYPRRPVPGVKDEIKNLYAEQNARWGAKSGQDWYFLGDVSKAREDYFYYGAILGINRAVDWIAAQPFVDGRDFTYEGQSQGGAFGIYLAALNSHLTRAQIGEPAITDLSGFLADKRQSGWPTLPEKFEKTPHYENVLRIAPYFDCAHFVPRIRIPTRWFVGFTDALCPPQAVWAGYNQLRTKDRRMLCFPGLGHGIPRGLYNEAERQTRASWDK